MTADELRAALEHVEDADEMWALTVVHDHGGLEHHTDLGALIVVVPESIENSLTREMLLTPEPVPCDVAEKAGVDLLNYCTRCEPGH